MASHHVHSSGAQALLLADFSFPSGLALRSLLALLVFRLHSSCTLLAPFLQYGLVHDADDVLFFAEDLILSSLYLEWVFKQDVVFLLRNWLVWYVFRS